MVTAIVSASPRVRRGINFADLIDQWGKSKPNPWVAVNQYELRELAVRCGAPLAWRMWMLAMGRMDRHGHSMWAPGELHESLVRLDRKTGELVAVDRSSITKALNTLITDGVVCDDSTTVCVRFSDSFVQSAYGKNRDCRVHR